MVQVVLVRPGSTDFDQQGRIQGMLDIPMSESGRQEVPKAVEAIRALKIEAVYAAPCTAARETAEALAATLDLKVKKLDSKMHNVNLGLWQGLLLEDVKHKQPKVYRQWQEHPETVCPPQGETLDDAQDRIQKGMQKLLRKHSEGTIAIVLPEPLASLVSSYLTGKDFGDLWKPSPGGCRCEVLTVAPQTLAASS